MRFIALCLNFLLTFLNQHLELERLGQICEYLDARRQRSFREKSIRYVRI